MLVAIIKFMLLVSLNVGFLIAVAMITNSSYLVIFLVQEIFTLVVSLTPCARAPPGRNITTT